jgi:hypothetical protein
MCVLKMCSHPTIVVYTQEKAQTWTSNFSVHGNFKLYFSKYNWLNFSIPGLWPIGSSTFSVIVIHFFAHHSFSLSLFSNLNNGAFSFHDKHDVHSLEVQEWRPSVLSWLLFNLIEHLLSCKMHQVTSVSGN